MNAHIARDSNRGTITRMPSLGPSPKATLWSHDWLTSPGKTSRFTRQDAGTPALQLAGDVDGDTNDAKSP